VREGDDLIDQRVYPAMRQDSFWRGPVLDIVRQYGPNYVVYDADGVGAGVIGYAEEVQAQLVNGQVIPFRGAKAVNEQSTNARSAWWWALRRRFEAGRINMYVPFDQKLKDQLMQMQYTIVTGKIRAITKEEMRKQGFASPDRADSIMYCFALADDLSVPVVAPSTTPYADSTGAPPLPRNVGGDHRANGRSGRGGYARQRRLVNPTLGVGDF
jgi:hypothetical protein